MVTLPFSCNHWKITGHSQLLPSITAFVPSGNTRGMFSQKPPPVMCEIA
ncbi:Uncharacterised protein [Vibrio cholerae]|nr:Uncharacterised protein [Vibrio cholerae]